ncbi:hypothetical protein Ancab_032838 [Ancistrocladus abbreviatus]
MVKLRYIHASPQANDEHQIQVKWHGFKPTLTLLSSSTVDAGFSPFSKRIRGSVQTFASNIPLEQTGGLWTIFIDICVPKKKSKEGRCFAIIRYLEVHNTTRLVNDSQRMRANIARFSKDAPSSRSGLELQNRTSNEYAVKAGKSYADVVRRSVPGSGKSRILNPKVPLAK